MQQMVTKILMLSLIGLIGFLAGRKKYLPQETGTILSRVVIKLTAPIIIALTMANSRMKYEDLSNGLWIYGFGILFLLFSYAISIVICKQLRLPDAAENVYKMQSMFGNVIFLAFPVLRSLYGDEGVLYSLFFNLANDTLLWTLGIYLVNKHHNRHWKENLKHMVNGNTIAFGIGILCIVFRLQSFVDQYASVRHIYTWIYDTLNPLGSTTVPLSMLFIGIILSEVKIQSVSDLAKRYPLFILSFIKLLAVPFLAFLVLTFIGHYTGYGVFVKRIVVLQLAMPCATIVPALASQYGSDYRFATEGVFITSILGIVTMPLIASLL